LPCGNYSESLIGSDKRKTLLRRGFSLPKRRPSDHSVGRRFVCGCDVAAFEVQPQAAQRTSRMIDDHADVGALSDL
jgi:hypothetical protein